METTLEDILELEKAVGVAQHHDAITGTERQRVAEDYHRCVLKITILYFKTTNKNIQCISEYCTYSAVTNINIIQ